MKSLNGKIKFDSPFIYFSTKHTLLQNEEYIEALSQSAINILYFYTPFPLGAEGDMYGSLA